MRHEQYGASKNGKMEGKKRKAEAFGPKGQTTS